MSSTVAKFITDTLLYFVSFRVQQKWVFRETLAVRDPRQRKW
jgi:hypothetical protein